MQAPELYRVTLATFDEPQRFWQALDAHREHGFNPAHLCMLGKRASFEALQRAGAATVPERRDFLSLLNDVAPLELLDPNNAVFGSANRFFTAWKEINAPSRRPHARCPLSVHTRGELLGRTAAGAVALLANSPTPELHALSARLLLQSSLEPVQTSTFMWPALRGGRPLD